MVFIYTKDSYQHETYEMRVYVVRCYFIRGRPLCISICINVFCVWICTLYDRYCTYAERCKYYTMLYVLHSVVQQNHANT